MAAGSRTPPHNPMRTVRPTTKTMRCCLILVTRETKSEETAFLQQALDTLEVPHELIDLSLGARGVIWDGDQKTASIQTTAANAALALEKRGLADVGAIAALGGGTGSDIALRVMAELPEAVPKVLITPLPFDPRPALAEVPVTLIPSVVDIAGLNPTLRSVLQNAAAMLAGLCNRKDSATFPDKTVGVSALGATAGAADNLVAELRDQGIEATVFHANGFGGAGFIRYARDGAFRAVIDMTCHEMTRMLFRGDHVDMPERFTAAGHLPRVLLPGGMNFLGLGPIDSLPSDLRARPLFRHSVFFTHVTLTVDQMAEAARALADALNSSKAPTRVLIPMGGFSHRDCPGGEIEDVALREVCRDTLSASARAYEIEVLPSHINDPETAARAIEVLRAQIKEYDHAQ